MGRLSTKEISLNIVKCLFVFYVVYYVVASVVSASFRLETFDGKIPFNFHTWIDFSHCCTGYSSDQLVNVISMELTFSLTGLVLGNMIRLWLWDYAITLTAMHVLVCSLVMLSFPLNWSWWVCLGCALLMMIIFGETVAFVYNNRETAKVSPSKPR